MAKESSAKVFNQKLIVTSLVAGLLLMIVNSAIWVNQQVFDTKNFTNTAVTAISSESSRKAIGGSITDQILRDNPVVKNIAGDQLTNLFSGLLGTDQANKLLTATVTRLQIYVTSSNQKDVDIDLSGLKDTLTRVAEIRGGDQPSRINPDKIPSKIVLIESKNVPNLYNYGVILTWVAVGGFVIAGLLLAKPYMSDRSKYLSIMIVQGASFILVGLVSLLIGPIFRPSVLEPFQNPNGRVVVGNLYNAFIATFNSQTMIFIWLGIGLIALSIVIRLAPKVLKYKK